MRQKIVCKYGRCFSTGGAAYTKRQITDLSNMVDQIEYDLFMDEMKPN